MAREIVIYLVVHQPRRLKLPAQPIPRGARPPDIERCLFDERLNERYFRKVSQRCYWPTVRLLTELVGQGLHLAIGFSVSFLRQAERWDPALLQAFQGLVRQPQVELVGVEPYHSFLPLVDLGAFSDRMVWMRQHLAALFGRSVRVTDTTEMCMSDPIAHALSVAGFQAGLMDGREWVLGWRQPTYLYRHGRLRLFTRHYQLSDDVGYRFSDRRWPGWPLDADRYADWLTWAAGEVVVLGWDFETFGEHHAAETGIFEFLRYLVRAVQARGGRFVTPSAYLDTHPEGGYDLPLPAFASTWAGSGGMEFFLGNAAQQALFQLMLAVYHKARLTGDPALLDLALWLLQSDNLHLIQWFGRSGPEAEVSAYFTPREWWELGPNGIISEQQRVYQNFLGALEYYLPDQPPIPPDGSLPEPLAERVFG